ncbi:MAG: hypothetical protein J6T01_02190 [Kiritimatiellae bacterium]|nr:hypothetical protein [Kiritimatiellia bacterium]
MKTRSAIAVLTAAAAISAAGAVRAVHKTHQPDKRPGFERESFAGVFDTCSIKFDYSLTNGVLYRCRRWGDYFCNILLGYSPRNGGWDRWDFLHVYVKTPKGVVNALSHSMPALFTGYSAGGADFIAAEWEVEGSGRLKLRFATFPSHRGWLFLRVETGGAEVVRVVLSAHPGNAAVPEGRERHLATKERDWLLNTTSAEFAPASPSILLYSLYVDEKFGNKLVFSNDAVEKVKSRRTTSGVSVDCTPKKGAPALDFALGYFAHCDPSDQLTRFLGEDGDAVSAFLKSIKWNRTPDAGEFRLSVDIARQMGVDGASLDAAEKKFRAAAAAADIAAVAGCFEEVLTLRRERARAGLDEYSAPPAGRKPAETGRERRR